MMKMYETDAATINDKISQKAVALLPVGATEMHGPHLPCGTDSILAERICQKLSEKIDAVILPTVHYTQVWSLGNIVGSIGLSSETLTKTIYELLIEINRNGFNLIIIVNTHVGNYNIIKEAVRMAYNNNDDIQVLYFSYPGAKSKIAEVMNQNMSSQGFFHADEIETSYMLYLAPEYVDMEKAINESPEIPELIDVTPMRWSEFTKTAVLGNALDATSEKGKAVIDFVISEMIRLISDYKGRKK